MNSVDLRGQPTAETAAQNVNTTQLASTAYVRSAVAALVDSAPGLLDTLNELAAAIADDADFSTTIANSIATKVSLDGSVAMTGNLTLSGAPVNNLHATTKQYVDDLVDAQMIYSTDDVAEGSTNLYYTQARVRSTISLISDNETVLDYDQSTGQFTYNHPTSDGVLEGATNLYFSNARARGAISMNSDDGTLLSYSSGTGVITFTTPDTDKVVEGATNLYFTTARARNAVSSGANIAYDSGTGVFSTQAAVWSVNTQTHDVVLDTDDINEGSANLYFTSARAASAISLTSNDTDILSYSNGAFTFVKPNTDAIAEGAVNLYYTNTRVRAAVSASGDISYNGATGNFSYSTPTTDGVAEGSTNLYFTNTRARGAVSLTSDNTDVLDYDSATGVFTFSLGSQTTDDVAEGTTNLYYTDTRARLAIDVAGWGNLSYNDSTGVITIAAPDTDDVTEGATNLYHTTTRARNAVSATQTSGDGTFSYDNTTGVFTFIGSDDADYRTAVSAYRDSGDGDLQYDSTTGVFTYTGPSSAEVRAHFSATTSGTGFGGLTYDSATGAFTYAKVTASDVRGNLSATTSGTGHGGLSYDSGTGVITFAKVTSANVRGEISATSASGVTYDSATGVIALASIPNSSLTNNSITINGATIALGASDTLDTDDIAEGTTNKYWTQARFDTALAASDTGDLAEGTNLYYTQARFDSALAAKDTDDVAEGSNLYFTTTRARNSVSGGTGVTYTAGTGVIEIGQPVATTDNVTFNDVTVSGDLTVQGTLTAIQSTTVEINDINLTLAKGAANAAAANGAGLTIDGAGATLTYASGTDTWNLNKSVNVTGGLTVTTSLTAPTFTGDLTGNVTGNVTGNLTGNVTGNLTGNVTSTGTSTFTTVDINGGNIDGTVVGGATPAAVTGTTITATTGFTGNVTGNVTGNLTGNVTGNLTGNVTGNVTGQVSDISNHNTDELSEGSTNLYYTDTRSRAALSGGNSGTGHGSLSYDSGTGAFTFAKVTASNIRGEVSANKVSGDGNFSYNSTTGVFSYTGPSAADARQHFSAVDAGGDGSFSYSSATGEFTYTGPSAAEARAHFSAVDAGGDGSFSYSSSTGEFTYTGPSAAEARAHFSATTATGAAFDSATGIFSLANIPNASLANNSITINGATIALGASDTLDTDDINEGSTNQYFLNSRARTAISLTTSDVNTLSYDSATGVFDFDLSGIDTDEVQEGTTNLYFTQTRARESISSSGWGNLSYDDATGVITITAPDTDDVTEGTNLYFTNTRARAAVSLTTDNSDALAYNTATGVFTFTLATVNTDEIAEGPTNLYFTTARARNTIVNGANIDYDAATGTVSTQAAVWSVNTQTNDVVLDTDDIDEGATNLYFTAARAQNALTLVTDDANILSYATGTLTFVTPDTDSIDEGAVNLYYTNNRADARIAAASIRDLDDVDADDALQDGYTLVWSSARGEFVPQNIAVTATTLSFTGDNTTTSFSTGVEVSSIDNTQVYINGLIQAPTYSYTLSTVSGVSSIVFDTAPETNDFIFVRVSSTSSLTAGGVLNESSNIDGGTY
jgi:hypothetical protein